MKKLVLLITIVFVCKINCRAQGNIMYPIADHYVNVWDINNTNLNIKYPGNLYLGCSLGNLIGGGSFTVEGSSEVDIKAKAINLKNTHLGSTDPNFKVHANTKSMAVASNYVATASIPQVPIYEKIEYGIELPQEIQSKINLFLNSNTSAANPNHPGLNPYDPQDISVEATITGIINDVNMAPGVDLDFNTTVYGFYYQEAIPSADMMSWNVNNATPYPFRIRFAPPWLGEYTITFKITYWNNGGYQIINLSGVTMFPGSTGGTMGFLFNGVANNSGKSIAKGYLEVGQHKRHLRHSYDKTSFFPIGMNLPELPEAPSFTWTGPSPIHKYTPWGYETRRNNYFSTMASNHGNFVRVISFSDVNAIERTGGSYEYHIGPGAPSTPETGLNLGNYQINQKHMAETDKDITKMEDLGIFTNFCLLIHFPFEAMNDSWLNDDWEHNAYRLELNLTNVKDFFSDPSAQRYFKNKLRYAQARWGYSAAIGMWQLASEISQFGNIALVGVGPYFHDSPYYDQDHVEKLYLWQCTMTNYLKNIYPDHLTNTCYALNPFNNYNPNGNLAACWDQSFTCPNMDIISWNDYNFDGAQAKNRQRFEAVHEIIYNENNLNCSEDPVGYFIDQPLLFTEVGNNFGYPDANIDKCTDIDVHNQMWAGAMSGELGTPLEWHNNTDFDALSMYFSNYNALSSFFDDIDFEANKYRPSVNSKEKLIDKGGSIFVNENMKLEIYVMQNEIAGDKSDRGFGWVNHIQGNWASQTQGFINGICSGPSTSNDDTPDYIEERIYNYKLNGFKAGNYLIDVYDTRSGSLIYSSNNNNDVHASIANILTLSIPSVDLYKSNSSELLDYAFKFWHASVNGNDLRIPPPNESMLLNGNINNQSVVLPGNNSDLKKYFLVDYYPNPSVEYITVVASGELIKSISLLDLTGKEVHEMDDLNSTKIIFNLADVAIGLYHLRVTSNSGISKIFKLVKQ
jgi:hypothetical protein